MLFIRQEPAGKGSRKPQARATAITPRSTHNVPMVRPTQLLHPQRAPAPVRPAATVLLLRDSPQGIEVLMTRRSMTASFAPGAYVFPGGGIDAADAQAHGQSTRRATQSDGHLTQAIATLQA